MAELADAPGLGPGGLAALGGSIPLARIDPEGRCPWRGHWHAGVCTPCLNHGMAQVEELGENRVRLTVDVSPHELEHAVEHAAQRPLRVGKIPGFRKGKVPRRCSSRRSAGTGSGSRRWSRTSAAGSGRQRRARVCGRSRRPSTTSSCPRGEEPWSFSATVEVQPTPEIVDWTTLEVPRRRPRFRRSSSIRSSRRCAERRRAGSRRRPSRPGGRHARGRPAEPLRRGAVRHGRRARLRPARRGDRAALVGASVGETKDGRLRARRRARDDAST